MICTAKNNRRIRKVYRCLNTTLKIYEVVNASGRLIYLTKERWSHIVAEHPVMSDEINRVEEVLINPIVIKESNNDSYVQLYYQHDKNNISRGKYLLVVVKYLNGKGFIITSFYTDKMKG